MSAPVISSYRSEQRPGRDGFGHLLLAEWTKFSSVRGWIAGLLGVVILTALATIALASAAVNNNSEPAMPTGPGGEAVTDSFYLAYRPLASDGSVTTRVTSLTGIADYPTGQERASQPWAKAGIIIASSTRPGASYAAMMVTPGHGVRMQYDYTHDVAGLGGVVSATSPRWLRLTRSGDLITGYDSADGTNWTKVGTADLHGLPPAALAGLFVASPIGTTQVQGFVSNNGVQYPTVATARFDHVAMTGATPGTSLRAVQAGQYLTLPAFSHHGPFQSSISPKDKQRVTGDFTVSAGRYVMSGGGDLAPYIPIVDPLGLAFKGSLLGLLAAIAIAALFITGEYRRGLIRTTFWASPRRGRVLAAKAIVIGSVTFVAGLLGAGIALPIASRKVEHNGWPSAVYPVRTLLSAPGLQIVVGTAALIAAGAVLTMAAGAVLRRSAGAVTAAIAILIVPLVLAIVLPAGPANWLLRLTPAAAFGLQQGTTQYSQVSHVCLPYNGCFPLEPWWGFAVLCAWALAALGVAIYLVRRRDA